MCSYCGCESIATIGGFMAEHIELVNATTALRLASADHDAAAAAPAADLLAHLLASHAEREENGLFPASAIALSGSEWDEVERTTPPPAAHRG